MNGLQLNGSFGDGQHNPEMIFDAQMTKQNNSEAHALKMIVELSSICNDMQSQLEEKSELEKRLIDFPTTLTEMLPEMLDVDMRAARERALADCRPEIDLISTISREQFEAQLQRTAHLRRLDREIARNQERIDLAERAIERFQSTIRQIVADNEQRLRLMDSNNLTNRMDIS
ncbi:hypothetical protein M3Y98_01211700 [Aphelenchoides besseyi]|nr:hypothetical protein M3Y98_01211700 [Aphelenchoides besseyi]KAI6193203.1 hypothetical protein M3Y96_00993400 [Aphelenchoides besseyi]